MVVDYEHYFITYVDPHEKAKAAYYNDLFRMQIDEDNQQEEEV